MKATSTVWLQGVAVRALSANTHPHSTQLVNTPNYNKLSPARRLLLGPLPDLLLLAGVDHHLVGQARLVAGVALGPVVRDRVRHVLPRVVERDRGDRCVREQRKERSARRSSGSREPGEGRAGLLLTPSQVGKHLNARACLEVPNAANREVLGQQRAETLERGGGIAHLMTPSPPADARVPRGWKTVELTG